MPNVKWSPARALTPPPAVNAPSVDVKGPLRNVSRVRNIPAPTTTNGVSGLGCPFIGENRSKRALPVRTKWL
jgi:hypothetical protein